MNSILNDPIKPFRYRRYVSSAISNKFDVLPDYQRYLFENYSCKTTHGIKAVIINKELGKYCIITDNTIDVPSSTLTHVNWFVKKLYKVSLSQNI